LALQSSLGPPNARLADSGRSYAGAGLGGLFRPVRPSPAPGFASPAPVPSPGTLAPDRSLGPRRPALARLRPSIRLSGRGPVSGDAGLSQLSTPAEVRAGPPPPATFLPAPKPPASRRIVRNLPLVHLGRLHPSQPAASPPRPASTRLIPLVILVVVALRPLYPRPAMARGDLSVRPGKPSNFWARLHPPASPAEPFSARESLPSPDLPIQPSFLGFQKSTTSYSTFCSGTGASNISVEAKK